MCPAGHITELEAICAEHNPTALIAVGNFGLFGTQHRALWRPFGEGHGTGAFGVPTHSRLR